MPQGAAQLNEGKMKTLADKEKLRMLISSRFVQQDLLKQSLQAEIKSILDSNSKPFQEIKDTDTQVIIKANIIEFLFNNYILI